MKSHLTEEVFLQAEEPELLWAWKANEAADALCTDVAGAYAAQHVHPGIVDWVDSRAWKLNKFLAERVKLWLTVNLPKTAKQPRVRKADLLTH